MFRRNTDPPRPVVTYPFVRAWGRYVGSGDERILQEVNRAAVAQAPPDAVYRVPFTREWVTAGALRDPLVREQVCAAAQRIAGRALEVSPAAPRCDALARVGTGLGVCDRVLDGGLCDRALDHVELV